MSDDQEDKDGPSRGFVASAVIVGMIGVAALFVILMSLTGGSREAPAGKARRPAPAGTGAQTAPVPASRVTVEDPRGCSLPAGPQAVPQAAPAVHWTLVGDMAAPSAPATFGPQRVVAGMRVCFAHNPTGALLALASFFAEATRVPQAQLYAQLAASTAARRVAIEEAQGDSQLFQQEDGDSGAPSLAAFLYADYTPQQANIDLVLQGPQGELVELPCAMAWQRGDWRFVVPVTQKLGAAAVSSLSGYVAFSAVSA